MNTLSYLRKKVERVVRVSWHIQQSIEAEQVNKEDIEKYLRMLGQELQKKQVTGEILLVGGAVMILEVGNREITKDIDAYFDPKYASAIREAATVIAKREGLLSGWLNDAVKG